MNEPQRTDSWVQAYLAAWTSNDPAQIGDLFSEEAEYYTAPYREPWTGRQAIVAGWLGRKDEPGTWTFRYEVLVDDGGLGVVEGVTVYTSQGRSYNNLWLIWLDPEGRCRKFVEYFMLQE